MGNNNDNIDIIENNNIESIDKKPDLNRSFSNNNNEDIRDFQSEHMIHKLKKIKKKKMKNNYKKVKEFDVLTNDKPVIPDTDNTVNDKSTTSAFQYIKNLIFNKKPIVEKFEDHEYEGGDAHKDIKHTRKPIQMTDNINEIYDLINYYNTYLAELLVGEDDTYNKESAARKDDIILVRNSIVWLECAFVSSIMVYNWYFAIYFATDPRNDIHIPSFSKEALIKYFTDKETGKKNPFIGTFVYFFEFAFWFPEMLDWVLLKIVPKTSGILNGTCNFLLLYFVCLYCTKNFAISFKNFFIDLFNTHNDPTGNMLINFMVFIIVILFFSSSFSLNLTPDMEGVKTVISIVTANPFVALIKFVIRAIITFFISVPAGAVLCGIYLIYMSFFSRLTWGKWSIFSVLFGMKSINDIDKHIRSSKAGFEEDDLCNSNSLLAFLYSLLSIIFNFLDYFKEHLLKIIYTIMLTCITVLLAINLSSLAPNKLPLNFFAAMMSIACIVMVITSIIRHYKLNKSPDTDSSPLGTTETTNTNQDTINPLNQV
tara:strand:+ start:2071 stop:3687 length:1617 start_codon:yes stop_codon:yes gene_type:complete